MYNTSANKIKNGNGNIYYPKALIDIVIYNDSVLIEEKIQTLETKLNELKSRLVDSINDKTGSSLTSNSTVDEMAAIIELYSTSSAPIID